MLNASMTLMLNTIIITQALYRGGSQRAIMQNNTHNNNNIIYIPT